MFFAILLPWFLLWCVKRGKEGEEKEEEEEGGGCLFGSNGGCFGRDG